MGPKKRTKKEKEKVIEIKKSKIQKPTVQEIVENSLTSLSLRYWASENVETFNAEIIKTIYNKELIIENLNKIMLLEVSHYLEK